MRPGGRIAHTISHRLHAPARARLPLVLVALLLANGARLAAAERAVNAARAGDMTTVVGGWRRLRAASIASLVLWIATVLAGVVLSNV